MVVIGVLGNGEGLIGISCANLLGRWVKVRNGMLGLILISLPLEH